MVPNESVQVNDAYNFIANIASNIVTGTLIVDPYQTTVTQNTSGTFASSNVVTTLANNISVITNIINNGPSVVAVKTPQSLIQTTNQNAINAWTMLHNNRAFIQAEVIAYINNSYPQLTYDKTKSSRDTGLLVDALVQDLLFNTDSQSTFAGLQYWKQNGYTGNLASQISTCIGAIEYASNLAQKIVVGDFTGTRQQNLVRQMTANTATNNEINLISNNFSICSGVNLYLINFAGLPPIKLYGSTFLTTWELLAITTPSPIVTPDIIVTLSPIHTSLPIITSPFVDG